MAILMGTNTTLTVDDIEIKSMGELQLNTRRQLGKAYGVDLSRFADMSGAHQLSGNNFTHFIVDEFYQRPGKIYPKPLAVEISAICGHEIEPIDFLTPCLQDLRI